MIKRIENNYKNLLMELNELEQVEYPISPEITNKIRGSIDYDKTSGLIGVCHFLGVLVWQMRMSFDTMYRPFVSEHCKIKTDKDRVALTLLHLIFRHIKRLFTDYDYMVLKILNYKEK